MIDRDEFSAWLRLLETPGVGREAARALARRVRLARRRSASVDRGAQGGRAARAGGGAGDRSPSSSRRGWRGDWQWLTSGDEARDVVALGDPRYPRVLLDSRRPAAAASTRAAASSCSSGPRSRSSAAATRPPQGLENARAFAAHLGGAGWVVVSGLALGIDGAAHEGALAGGGGTIAVVGTGLDRRLPASGTARSPRRSPPTASCVSEFAVGTPALAENFPIRNRIIAGLARGTLVVEAAVQSGSLITARLALEAGRDVFAIPGSIHSPQSRGCHALIKQGAKLVDSAHDIVDELAPLAGRAAHGVGCAGAGTRAGAPRTPSSTRSASIRSASTSWSPAPAGAPPSCRRGCSISSCRAGSPACPASVSSASSAADAASRRTAPAAPPFVPAGASARGAAV